METERTAQTVAAELRETFTPNERHGVRFGLFPAVALQEAQQHLSPAEADKLAVALMDVAAKNGGTC